MPLFGALSSSELQHCNALQRTAPHRTAPHCTAPHCQRTAPHCISQRLVITSVSSFACMLSHMRHTCINTYTRMYIHAYMKTHTHTYRNTHIPAHECTRAQTDTPFSSAWSLHERVAHCNTNALPRKHSAIHCNTPEYKAYPSPPGTVFLITPYCDVVISSLSV